MDDYALFSGVLNGVADEMRKAGVRRLAFVTGMTFGPAEVKEIELSDTIPAPPSFETMPTDFPPAENKDGGLCQGVGCALEGGWHGTPYCRAHGLSAAGVRT